MTNDVEVTAEVIAEPNDAPSMDDTIRDTLRTLTKDEPDATEEATDTTEAKPARARGADGKFLGGAGNSAVEVAPAGNAAAATAASAGTVSAAAHDAYPSSWKKELEPKWKTADAELRAEIHRREQNFLDGLKEYKQPAAFGRAIGEELLPHLDTMRRMNTTPQAVVRDAMRTWGVLANGDANAKQSALLQLARDFGIELSALRASPPNAQAQAAQGLDLSPVTQRIDTLEQALQAQRAEAESLRNQQIDSELDAFGKSPGHEHYADVRVPMGQMLMSGLATSLQDAYDKATWASPEIRAKVQAKADEDRRAKEAEQAAAARKAASTNVRPRGTPPVARKQGTMEDTIRDQYRSLTTG